MHGINCANKSQCMDDLNRPVWRQTQFKSIHKESCTVFFFQAVPVPLRLAGCDVARDWTWRFIPIDDRITEGGGLPWVIGLIRSKPAPAAAPAIFTGVYLALIYSWLATIGAEYLLVAGVGIGNLLIEGSEHFQMDLVIFGMFVVGVIGWLMNALARVAERRLARLRGQDQ